MAFCFCCTCGRLLTFLIVVFAAFVHWFGVEVSDLDPRTPGWLRSTLIWKPWRFEKAACVEGGRCEFQEQDFWSPENRTLDNGILIDFFFRASPPFQNRAAATMAALHKRYLKRLSEPFAPKPSLGFFQIGPNIPAPSEVFFMQVYSAAVGDNARWVLVEPQEPIIKEVESSALSAGFGRERTFIINAAMCPSADKDLELWKFKDGAAAEVETKMGDVRKWSTLGGKDVLLNTWRRNVIFYNWPVEERHQDDLEDWVESLPVKCHTPATLLKEVRMEPRDVDFLFIDAEGYDAEILQLFRSLPGFNPAVIIFEWAFHHASRKKLHLLPDAANYWSQKGYAVYKDQDNLVIFKTDGS